MPSGAKELRERSIRRQKSLGMAGRCAPLHAMRPLARRSMRVLAPVLEIPTLAMLAPWADPPLCRTIALHLVRQDDPWHVLQALQQLAKEVLGRLRVPAALYQHIQHVVVLIHRPPQLMALPVDRQKDRVNGLITNDTFCLIRHNQITLQWSRNLYRFRPRKSQYAPDETARQGRYHETPVADTALVSANCRR
jgi:hypothetical protein